MNRFSGSIRRNLGLLIPLFFFVFIFLSFISGKALGPDTSWHLKTGEYITVNKTIPETDPFSYADDPLPFIGKFILTQYWLSQTLFFLVYKTSGTQGLIIFDALIFTTISMLIWSMLSRKGIFIQIIVSCVAFVFLREVLEVRPQIFTFLLTALTIFLAERYRDTKNPRYAWPLPLIMLIWANMHGGFIYGIVLIMIYAVSEATGLLVSGKSFRALAGRNSYFLLICILSVLVSMLNPNTYKAFMYAFTTHSQNLFAYIQEYLSPWFILRHNPVPLIYSFWLVLAVSVIASILFIRQGTFLPVLMIAFSAGLALVSIRYIMLFIIVATASFRHLPFNLDLKLTSRANSVALAFLLLVFLGLSVVASASLHMGALADFRQTYTHPVQAVNFLRDNDINGRIFASYNQSSYIMFKQYPGSRLYSDSRYLSEKRMEKILKIEGEYDPLEEQLSTYNSLVPRGIGTIKINASGGSRKEPQSAGAGARDNWKKLLDGIDAEIIVHEAVNHVSGKIFQMMFRIAAEDDWKLVYADGFSLIFVKDLPKFREVVRKYALPKSVIFDEIISETGSVVDRSTHVYYTNIALAMLLKGIADYRTDLFIRQAISLAPNNVTANYCRLLYGLMRR